MRFNKRFLIFVSILIAICTVIKIICAPNINLSGFSGVIAVALFAGLKIKDKSLSFLLPLATLFISDLIIQLLYVAHLFPFAGFYTDQLFNYGLFFLVTLIGMGLSKLKNAGIVAGIVIGPLAFFLISNYIVWAMNVGVAYSRDFAGLMESYGMGLPFYRNSLLSTAIFLPSFIMLYNFIVKQKYVAAKHSV